MSYKTWINTSKGIEFRKQQSNRMIENNPMKHEKNILKRLEKVNYDEIGKKISNTRIKKFKTGEIKVSDETRKKISSSLKGKKDVKKGLTYKEYYGEKRANQISIKIKNKTTGLRRTIKTKRKLSKYRIDNPQRNFKDNNGNWCGGVANNKYSHCHKEWKELRIKVLKRDGNQCRQCKSTEDLVVHHIDFTKTNNILNNLMCLCRRCNSGVNNGRYELKC